MNHYLQKVRIVKKKCYKIIKSHDAIYNLLFLQIVTGNGIVVAVGCYPFSLRLLLIKLVMSAQYCECFVTINVSVRVHYI